MFFFSRVKSIFHSSTRMICCGLSNERCTANDDDEQHREAEKNEKNVLSMWKICFSSLKTSSAVVMTWADLPSCLSYDFFSSFNNSQHTPRIHSKVIKNQFVSSKKCLLSCAGGAAKKIDNNRRRRVCDVIRDYGFIFVCTICQLCSFRTFRNFYKNRKGNLMKMTRRNRKNEWRRRRRQRSILVYLRLKQHDTNSLLSVVVSFDTHSMCVFFNLLLFPFPFRFVALRNKVRKSFYQQKKKEKFDT